jgi:uncharacterized delta-60 repeat protein
MRLIVGAATAVAVVSMCFCASAFAGEGVPDPSFGDGGVATYSSLGFGNSPYSRFNAVGVSADGKIYAAGESGDGAGDVQVLAARAGENGALDATFGSGGAVINTPLPYTGKFSQSAQALAIEPGDSIVVAGDVTERITASGQPTALPNASLQTLSLTQLPGGVLAAAGYQDYEQTQYFGAVELKLPNGQPDVAFGNGGLVLLPCHSTNGCFMKARSIVERPNGDLLVSGDGETGSPSSAFLWIAMLTPAGALVGSFGNAGVSVIEGDTHGGLLEPRPGGLTLVGELPTGVEGAFQLAVWGLTSGGTPDLMYGTNGLTTLPIPPGYDSSLVNAATVDPSGRLLVTGRLEETDDQHPYLRPRPELVRVDPNGQVDKSFGEAGVALGPPHAFFLALTTDSSGRVIAAGTQPTEVNAFIERNYALLERFGEPHPGANTPTPPATTNGPAAAQLRARIAARLAGELYPRGRTASVASLLKHHGCTLSLQLAAPGHVQVDWWDTRTIRHGKKHRTLRLLVASGTASLAASGHAQLHIRLTRAGTRLLKTQQHPLKLTATATLKLPAQKPIDVTQRFTLSAR